jgi:hypothetical protein
VVTRDQDDMILFIFGSLLPLRGGFPSINVVLTSRKTATRDESWWERSQAKLACEGVCLLEEDRDRES